MRTDVVVIGGGIIGASSALQLARGGAQVTLIDQDIPGHGCSYGNAGWMTPCFAMPLPMPGMLIKSMGWLLNPESPLYIKPSLSPDLLSWLTRFLFSMNEKKAKSSIELLIALSQESLRLYEELSHTQADLMKFEKKGLLMISQTASGRQAAIEELKWGEPFGVIGEILSGERAQELEPSLKKNLGGVYFQNEAHAEPLGTVQALLKEGLKLGVKVVPHCQFQGLGHRVQIGESQSLKSIKTSLGEMFADQFVFAMGSWSKAFGQELGLNIPILGGKGYSIILPKLQRQPKIPIMLIEKKVAITPRENSLRVAGTLELVDQDFSITQRRMDAVVKGARQILEIPEKPQYLESWRGLRPCTPDGLPLLGRSPAIPNMVLACGHQMLGLQTGLGSGQFVAEVVLQNRSQDPRLDPTRFT
ncbi:MAG: FAD-dependent oxidoreductase [Proteobacteria bacterium]|jgi:D-amino-acid dehydrogenase|nr:FAD-dependent oxidoreductase [Pseudomonadota bacterium]